MDTRSVFTVGSATPGKDAALAEGQVHTESPAWAPSVSRFSSTDSRSLGGESHVDDIYRAPVPCL